MAVSEAVLQARRDHRAEWLAEYNDDNRERVRAIARASYHRHKPPRTVRSSRALTSANPLPQMPLVVVYDPDIYGGAFETGATFRDRDQAQLMLEMGSWTPGTIIRDIRGWTYRVVGERNQKFSRVGAA